MKFRGLDPRTEVVRWGMFAVAVGIVAWRVTGPTAIHALATAWKANRASRRYLLPAALRLPGVRRGRRLGHLRPAALDQLDDSRTVRSRSRSTRILASFGSCSPPSTGCCSGSTRASHSASPSNRGPGLAPYAPVWVAVGQFTFYLMVAVVASFYVRRQVLASAPGVCSTTSRSSRLPGPRPTASRPGRTAAPHGRGGSYV